MKLPETHYLTSSLSADGLVKSGGGFFGGFLVTASSSGVVRFYDNTAASGTVIVDQLSVTAGTNYPFRAEFKTGLFFDLVSGSATVTTFYI